MIRSERLRSLDVLRGIAIASMILVNNPGSWEYVYPPLLHAEWHGFTPTDWVFPAFLFISGTAMAFSMRKSLDPSTRVTLPVYGRILRRCILFFLIGLFLNSLSVILTGFPNFDFSGLRIMGVLQRISLAYAGAAIAILHVKPKGLWLLSALILLGYWAIMTLVPIPGLGLANLSPEGNFAAYIDRLILTTDHLYLQGKFDPEGLLSTLPAIVTVLLGYLAGDWLRSQTVTSQTSLALAQFGLMGIISGWLWGMIFPINKQLWTSSYVLYSAGWTVLILALCYELIEVRKLRRWSFPFEIMGVNALFVFVASGIVVRFLYRIYVGNGQNRVSLYTWFYQHFFQSWAGSFNGSLLFAIANVLFWWLILYILYRQRWLIKL